MNKNQTAPSYEDALPNLKIGLAQIPKRGLLKLKKALEDKDSPLLFNGYICNSTEY